MRSLMRAMVGGAMAIALVCVLTPQSAQAGCDTAVLRTCGTDEHAATLLTRGQVLALEKYPGDNGGQIVEARPLDAPIYDYVSLNDCVPARPETPTEQVTCSHALRDCPPDEIG